MDSSARSSSAITAFSLDLLGVTVGGAVTDTMDISTSVCVPVRATTTRAWRTCANADAHPPCNGCSMRATIAASMRRTPLPVPLAVIVPAYNRSSSLNRALMSVGVQTLTPAEVVVVDDASSDDTAEAARSLGARVIVHEVNRGEGAARNTALAATEQPWAALLDSDDEWLPTHLEDVWAARDGHVLVADAALSSGGSAGPRVYGWPGRRPRVLRSPAAVAFPANVVQPSAALADRAALLAAGGFPVGMRQAGDLHTWLRLLERGTGVLLPSVGVRYHLHEGQVSADRAAMFASEL